MSAKMDKQKKQVSTSADRQENKDVCKDGQAEKKYQQEQTAKARCLQKRTGQKQGVRKGGQATKKVCPQKWIGQKQASTKAARAKAGCL